MKEIVLKQIAEKFSEETTDAVTKEEVQELLEEFAYNKCHQRVYLKFCQSK